ncbi:pyridine nucleotide-disulfide oxidoreductase [Halobacteriales archaeon QH_7_66_36]|nr:MAG: pyridine nucleotide-disulfide oxidoreductase [Halobacteriales archaeon QH_7_66_36]
MSERIVVLGAGAGGTMAANRLDRELGGLGEVVVVDRDPTHRYQPAYYLYPFDHLSLDDHTRDGREYLRTDVQFCEATVTGIDPNERRVTLGAGELSYDRLVVSLGHELVDEVPWRGEPHAYPFYRPEGARELATTLDRLVARHGDGEADAVSAPARDPVATDGAGTASADAPLPAADPADPLRVLVTEPETPMSCGGAPAKAALLAEDYLADHGVPCDVTLAGPDAHVFGTGKKAKYDERLTAVFDERGVEYVPEFSVADVADGTVTATDGRALPYDLYLPVSPQRCPRVLTDASPLTAPDEAGREYVAVDEATMRHREVDRVYALGDCTDAPTSRTAAAARKQAAALADNLTADVTGRAYEATYDGFAACPLLTEKGKAILAAYDYDGATLPAVESRLGWIADLEAIPRLYWQVWLRGYLLGV